jgi:hypothetical protein
LWSWVLSACSGSSFPTTTTMPPPPSTTRGGLAVAACPSPSGHYGRAFSSYAKKHLLNTCVFKRTHFLWYITRDNMCLIGFF